MYEFHTEMCVHRSLSRGAQRVTTGLQRALEQGESLETPLKIEPFVGFEAD
jgi:hypothetical protein